MLDALDEETRDRWTGHDELLRTLILTVDLVRREQIVLHGGEAPDPIEVRRPTDPEPKKSWVSKMRELAGGGD